MIARKEIDISQLSQIEAVKFLADGTRTARAIQELLLPFNPGLTLGAVFGVVRRNGGEFSGQRGVSRSVQWRKGGNRFQHSLEARPQAPDANPVNLLQITDRQCKRPMWVGEPPIKERFYCGAPVDLHQTYCEHCQTFLYEQKEEAA